MDAGDAGAQALADGGWDVRYRRGWKGARVRKLLALIERRTPWLRVRYAF